jgi:histidine ammonia-lyase
MRENQDMDMNPLTLNGSNLTMQGFEDVVYRRRSVQIDESRRPLLKQSRQVLFDMAAEGKPVYGLNHGVGWNKDREFGVEFFERFNRNLIRSHSVGVLPYAEVEEVRAMMLIRLNTALCCRSGISTEVLDLLVDFLMYN